MNTSTRRFTNSDHCTVYVVQVNGDEGCYFHTGANGDVLACLSYGEAFSILDRLQDSGEYGEIQTFEPGETIDMDAETSDEDEDDCDDEDAT